MSANNPIPVREVRRNISVRGIAQSISIAAWQNIVTASLGVVLVAIALAVVNVNREFRTHANAAVESDFIKQTAGDDAYEMLYAVRRMDSMVLRFGAKLISKEELDQERQILEIQVEHYKSNHVGKQGADRSVLGEDALDSATQLVNAVQQFELGRISLQKAIAASSESYKKWGAFKDEWKANAESQRSGIRDSVLQTRFLAERSAVVLEVLLALFATLGCLLLLTVRRNVAMKDERFAKIELLIASIGHDLRSPLQAITTAGSLLSAKQSSVDRQRYANVIKTNAESLACFVDDILAVVRRQKVTLKLVDVDIQDWADSFSASYQTKATSKGLRWTVSVDASMVSSVNVDPDRLRQCIGNLVDNAVRYTDTGGVDVSIIVTPYAIGTTANLVVSVADTGVGIDDKDRHRIFKPFERAARFSDMPGKGLGLSIVENLVKAFGGTLELNSKKDNGSRFTVHIPVRFKPAAPGEVLQKVGHIDVPVIPVPHSNAEILVVDDDADILDMTVSLLRKASFEVNVAANGFAGWESVVAGSYRVVITDIQMPGINGVDLARRIRASRANVYLIGMTADVDKLVREHSQLFDAVLKKPFSDAELLDCMQKAEDVAFERALA